jgi:hypothetical protein
MLFCVLHRDEAVHHLAEPGESLEGHLDRGAPLGGDYSYLYAGGAEAGQGSFDAGKLPYQGVVVLVVVEPVGL